MDKGDKFVIDGSKGFNHGCRDYAIAEFQGDGVALIIEAQSCHSCWQVGHDSDHVFARIGEHIDVDTGAFEEINPGNWVDLTTEYIGWFTSV